MQDGIVIKSSKAGMTVILNPDLPFPDLLASIAKKFGDSARFWGNAQMTLTLEGRPLSAEEEFQIVNTITENSQLQILCLLDTDAERIERCEKALNEKLMELSAQTGQFYRGTLKRGDTLAGISKKMYQSYNYIEMIAEANGIDNVDEIYPGQILEIPQIED